MQYRELSLEEIEEIYQTYLVVHFPADEVKPLKNIRRMYEEGTYVAIGAFDGGTERKDLRGYAFLAAKEPGKAVLLDYLAVLPQYRNLGAGAQILRNLAEHPVFQSPRILIEAENPDHQKGEAREMAIRRLNFYERSGAQLTGLKTAAFGVHYRIFVLQKDPLRGQDDALCRDALCEIYRMMIPDPQLYEINYIPEE